MSRPTAVLVNALRAVLCDPEGRCCIEGSDADRKIVDNALATLSQNPERGVSEAMVAELIAAGDFLAMNGTDGMVRRWERAKATLSAQPAAQGEAVDPAMCAHKFLADPRTCSRCGWDFRKGAPPAQPAERVPEGWRKTLLAVVSALDVSTGDSDPNFDPDMTDDEVREEYPEVWAMQQITALLASPAPSEGGKGVEG